MAAVTVAIVLVAGLGFVLTNLTRTPMPEPVWTEADLPTLPAAADNGWTLLQAAPPGLGRSALAEAPGTLDKVLEATSVADAQAVLEPMRALAAQPGAAAKRCEAAFARRHMAYGCKPLPDSDCTIISFHQCHAWWLTKLLIAQTSSEPQPIATRLTEQLDKDEEMAATATSLLGQSMVALALEDTVELAWWLKKHRPEALNGVQLGRLKGRLLNVKQAVMGEYLFSAAAIDMTKSNGKRLFYDAGATMQLLNDTYRPAREGDYTAIALPPRSRWWWWRNAAGRQLLDVTMTFGNERYRGLDEGEQERMQRAAGL